ncbi:MAG TPA: hypothetical protein VE439_09100, partial [Anaerolineae bacterium]|nr:hypothetical protein [Anaerolineae bacterium]
ALLGGCPSSITGPLIGFASSFGRIYQASHHPIHAGIPDSDQALHDARNRALAGIRSLPAVQYRFLEELIEL